jgi:hypothetical protein
MQISASQSRAAPACPCVANLHYFRRAAASSSAGSTPFSIPQRGSAKLLSERALAALQLLAADTSFGTDARKAAVRELLPTAQAKRAALDMAAIRGRQNMIPRSDLEDICAADIGGA